MAVRVQVNYAGIRELMGLRQVRDGLNARARPIAARARAVAAGDRMPATAESIAVQDGTRPRGRTYSRVVSQATSAVEKEHRSTPTARRRVLQRAADIGA